MKRTRFGLALAVLVCLVGIAPAETILINFGGGTLPDNWNQVPSSGGLSTVIDSDENVLDGVSVTTSGFKTSALANSGTYGGPPAGWADLDEGAVSACFYNQWTVVTVTISGLTESAYRVDFLAARSTAGNVTDRLNLYYVNGELTTGESAEDPWSSYEDGWVAGGMLTWNSVAPDSGSIAISNSADTATYNNGHWTAIRLVAVPEPASMSLLVLGGVAVLQRRRRR